MSLNVFVLLALACLTCCAFCAPLEPAKPSAYNLENYDEVYDQRQNGTENYKLNVNGVVVMWASPLSLFSAALLHPGLFEGEYPDLEEILNPQNPEKPEDLLIVKPDSPSSSSTSTSLPPSTSEVAHISAVTLSNATVSLNPAHESELVDGAANSLEPKSPSKPEETSKSSARQPDRQQSNLIHILQENAKGRIPLPALMRRFVTQRVAVQ